MSACVFAGVHVGLHLWAGASACPIGCFVIPCMQDRTCLCANNKCTSASAYTCVCAQESEGEAERAAEEAAGGVSGCEGVSRGERHEIIL